MGGSTVYRSVWEVPLYICASLHNISAQPWPQMDDLLGVWMDSVNSSKGNVWSFRHGITITC